MSHRNLRKFILLAVFCFALLPGIGSFAQESTEVAGEVTQEAATEAEQTAIAEPSPTVSILPEASPELTEMPEPNPEATAIVEPTSISTSTPMPMLPASSLPLILATNFDSGLPDEILTGQGWSISPQASGFALHGTESNSIASLSYSNLSAVELRLDFYLSEGAFQINLGMDYALLLRADNQAAIFKAEQALQTGSFAASTDGWHSLSFAQINQQVSVYIDTVPVFVIPDSNPSLITEINWQGIALGTNGLLLDELALYGTIQAIVASPSSTPSPSPFPTSLPNSRPNPGGQATILTVTSYVVNTTSDTADANAGDGICDTDLGTGGNQCSLRAAIQESNASVGDEDTIEFNIMGPGVQTIVPTSALPAISDPVLIDGYTQPGSAVATGGSPATILIEINGTNSVQNAGAQGTLTITGGGTTVRGLVINRSGGHAIWLFTGAGNTNNVIQGNYLGTDATGSSDLGNVGSGVAVSSQSNLIGGTLPSERNLISGNDFYGITLSGASNTVSGNYIGTNASGTSAIANLRGISIHSLSNTIGGTGSGAGNLIYGNGTGVYVNTSVRFNAIEGNRIFGNTGLEIDLNRIVPMPNDVLDIDGGGNDRQNYPFISSVVTNGSNFDILGRLHSTADSSYRLEFFSSTNCDSSGAGEAENYLGFTNVTTDASGDSNFSLSLPVQAGSYLTAIATNSGNSSSDISLCTLIDGFSSLVVSNENNSGYGSLRRAIISSNANVNYTDTISFNIQSPAPYLISLSSSLDDLTDPVIIDGTSQGGYTGTPIIQINGNGGGAGLEITGGNSSIRGLVIQNFFGSGITLSSSGNTIQNNYIGTDLTGTSDEGNVQYGIYVPSGSNNLIGGVAANDGNIIAFNHTGILISGGTGNQISGNSIFSNSNAGIELYFADFNDALDADSGENNRQNYPFLTSALVDGANWDIEGTLHSAADTSYRIEFYSNISCDSTGFGEGRYYLGYTDTITNASGNANYSVSLSSQSGTFITAIATDPNGNSSPFSFCIELGVTNPTLVTNTNDSGSGSLRNAMLAANANSPIVDTISFALSGSAPFTITLSSALPYIYDAVILDGTTQSGYTNVPLIEVAGNGQFIIFAVRAGGSTIRGFTLNGYTEKAIDIDASDADANTIQGNYIGTDSTGTLDMTDGNNDTGIYIVTDNNIIGGTGANEGNLIAFNRFGIRVGPSSSSLNNRISGNSIFSNSDMGIDIYPIFVNANDGGDGDTGANNRQNFPVLSVAENGANIDITTALNSAANTSFRIEYFSSTSCHSTGYGEGQTYLGYSDLTTDLTGNNSIVVSFPIPLGAYLTATATDPAGNTSEFSACSRIHTATTVSNTNDSGAGSLRQAIINSNSSVGVFDTIDFDIAGSGVHTISPNSPLPQITDPVLIDGYTETGSSVATLSTNAVLLIELNGTNAGSLADGLSILAGDTIVRGLVINRFDDDCIELGSSDNQIYGNYLGTNTSGTSAAGCTAGIYVSGVGDNQIGNTTVANRNLISGNDYGIIVFGAGSANTIIQGNYIGTNASGTSAVGNIYPGIQLFQTESALIEDNLVSGNGIGDTITVYAGIEIIEGDGQHMLFGNKIGSNAAGMASIENYGNGIYIENSSYNSIGGTVLGQGNLIGGNTGRGVYIYGSLATNNAVLGNTIGINAGGTFQLPNTITGVTIYDAPYNQIGGSAPGAGNAIGSNGVQGIWISGPNASNNQIQGNVIGDDWLAGSTFPNGFYGIVIVDATANLIGGPNAGEGNYITGHSEIGVLLSENADNNIVQGNAIHNNQIGVYINAGSDNNLIGGTNASEGNSLSSGLVGAVVDGSVNNAILGNSIHSQLAIGIELYPPIGINSNDSKDVDTGSNNRQNFPVFQSITNTAGTTTVNGILNSTPNTSFRIELFANGICHDSLYGGGYSFLGAVNVVSDSAGNAYFTAAFPTISGQTRITATATDANNNTSEFSRCITAANPIRPANAPGLRSPASNFFSNDNQPSFQWNSVANATSYQILVDNNSNFSSPEIDVSASSLSYDALAALPDGVYYWRVRGRSSVGDGPWSGFRVVTIDTSPPSAPNLSNPTVNRVMTTARPAFSWVGTTGANRYRLQVDDNSDFSSPIISQELTTLSYISPVSLPQGTYYWRVQARDAALNWGSYGEERSFTVNIQRLPANNGYSTDTTPIFQWYGWTGASRYQLQVDDNSDFSSPLIEFNTTNASVLSHSSTTVLSYGTYNWRVNIDTGSGFVISPFYWTVTISPSPAAAPVLLSPASGFLTNDNTPDFTWNPSMSTLGQPYSYEIQIGITTDFSSLSQVQILGTSNYTAGTLPDGTYYWRVRTLNYLNVGGAWSAHRSIRIDTTAPLAPNLSNPTVNRVMTTARPVFSWLAATGANRYRLQVDDNSDFSSPIINHEVTTLSYTSPVSLPQGSYYWRVQSRDAALNWGSFGEERSFTVNIQRSIANNGYSTDTTPPFQWYAWTGATRYQLQLDDSNDFSSPLIEFNTANASVLSYSSVTVLGYGTYYWRVNIDTGSGFVTSPFHWTLTISPSPAAAPTLLSPVNSSTTADTTPDFIWNASASTQGQPYTYQIQIDNNADFSSPVVDTTTSSTSYTSGTVSAGWYYWRVRTVNAYGVAGPWSIIRSVRIQP